MAKYLDSAGLSHLWAKIKGHVSTEIGKLDVEAFDLATVSDGVVTLNQKLSEVDGKIIGGTGVTGQTSIVFAKVATTGKAEDVSVTGITGLSGTDVQSVLEEIAENSQAAVHDITGDAWIGVTGVAGGTYALSHGGPTGETTAKGDTSSSASWGQNVITEVIVDAKGHVSDVVSHTLPVNPVTAESVAADKKIMIAGGTNAASESGYAISDTLVSGSTGATFIPTSKAVDDAINTYLVGGVKYKGTVDTTSGLPASGYKKGDLYVVAEAGTYAGKACEVGDWLLANKDYVEGATAANDWDAVSGENQVESKNALLAMGSTGTTIATVDGTDIVVRTPELGIGLSDSNNGAVINLDAAGKYGEANAEIGGLMVSGHTGSTVSVSSDTRVGFVGQTGEDHGNNLFGVQSDVNNMAYVEVPYISFDEIDAICV